MMRIRKRISGLSVVLLAVASGAFTMYDHASAVPASPPDAGTSAPAFMAVAPLFASARTIARDFAEERHRIRVSSFSVGIAGNDIIPPNDYCYWESIPMGGTPPYTYQWYGGSSFARDQSSIFAKASWSFWLDVKVTDSNGEVGWGYLYVTVSEWSGACLI
jgi:hypothetical protein